LWHIDSLGLDLCSSAGETSNRALKYMTWGPRHTPPVIAVNPTAKKREGWKDVSKSRAEISQTFGAAEVNDRVRWLEPGTAINT